MNIDKAQVLSGLAMIHVLQQSENQSPESREKTNLGPLTVTSKEMTLSPGHRTPLPEANILVCDRPPRTSTIPVSFSTREIKRKEMRD
jgi:hypothetical protein